MNRRSLFYGFVLFGLISGVTAPVAQAQHCASTAAGHLDQGWPDYQVIIWQDQTPLRLTGLARLGVTAGRVFGTRGSLDLARKPQETAVFRALNLRWYVENIATDFYAAYHRWHPDHPVTWFFDESKRLYREVPAGITTFLRTPSLSDPAWLRAIVLRLRQHVRAYALYRPLYYSLADEAGIADLAAAWDFDFAPASLAGMRVWLKQRYGTLVALNREWGTRFRTWSAVMPMTTDAALNQPDENFSAWADFKEWMDVAFARAVQVGTDAVHAVDPRGRAALEGAQPPGWGGYDYSRLATAVDVMEMYDAGNNVEIARSLAPDLITLTTSSLADAQQIHSIWHELLLGGRGLILWDANNAFVEDDGRPTPRGQVLGALAAELRSGIAAQLISSTPATDPVAILYSPASFRTQWLLNRRADGLPWVERGSETEDLDSNPVRAATRRFAGMLTHLGLQPRWLTGTMIERGILRTGHIRVLMLPHAIALSSAEAQRDRAFTSDGGVVMADSEPGLFDAHSRRLERSLLADLIGSDRPIALMPALQQDAKPNDPAPLTRLQQILEKAGLKPRLTMLAPSGALVTDIDARIFCNGDVTIVGLQRDLEAGNDGASEDVILGFNAPVYVYNMRRPGPPQYGARITLTLDPITPALVAVASAPVPELTIIGPTRARLGTSAEFAISGMTSAAGRIINIEVTAPDGTVVPAETTNLAVRGPRATWRLLLTQNDPVGEWIIRMVDVLGARRTELKVAVFGVSSGN